MKKLRILSRLFTLVLVAYTFLSGPLPGDETTGPRRRPFRRLKRIGVVACVIVVTAVAATALYLMFSGPRMRIQPKYLPYQAQMPPMPEGIVPVSLPPASVSPENPLPDTEKTLVAGRVYYGYYCAFCHGGAGEGTGPVGRSFVPAPTRLTPSRIQAMSDGELYRAMFTGVGHEPVLDYVIDAQARWYIVSYVRTLGNERP